MLPHESRVDEGVMAVKGYSTFPKVPALQQPNHQIVLCHIYGLLIKGYRSELSVHLEIGLLDGF